MNPVAEGVLGFLLGLDIRDALRDLFREFELQVLRAAERLRFFGSFSVDFCFQRIFMLIGRAQLLSGEILLIERRLRQHGLAFIWRSILRE